jgi:hypothetical protein
MVAGLPGERSTSMGLCRSRWRIGFHIYGGARWFPLQQIPHLYGVG